MRTMVAGVLALLGTGAYGLAQNVISAKSGLIHYLEGEVYVNDKLITPKRAEFPRLEAGQIIRTAAGRAEVLLTPGVFLRVSEDSEATLTSSSLADTRVELLKGSVLLEVGEIEKENSVMLIVGEAKLDFRKHGLFRIDADPASVHVFDGEVIATRNGQTLTVKEGRESLLNGVLASEKFDKEETDSFHRWASRRAGYLASANLSAAKTLLDNGTTWTRSGWFYNQWFGMYTYLPGSGSYYSPFGYSYYSPRRVEAVFYRPAPGWNNQGAGGLDNMGGGMRGAAVAGAERGAAGYSGMSARSAPSAPAPAAPAAAPRGGDAGTSRGSRGGR